MGGFFSTPKPPKPDTSAIDRQIKLQEDQAAERKKRNQSRIRNLRARRGGRANPFLFASLQGVDDRRDTLG